MSRPLTPQHIVNEFLQAELHHTMGAYGVAVTEFQRVAGLNRHSSPAVPKSELTHTIDLNRQLLAIGAGTHPAGTRKLHPKPKWELLEGEESWSELGTSIADFYATAEAAIAAAADSPPYADNSDFPEDGLDEDSIDDDAALLLLGKRLGITHDPQRRGHVAGGQATPHLMSEAEREEAAIEAETISRQGKLARTRERQRSIANDLLARDGPAATPRGDAAPCARHILFGHLRADATEGQVGLCARPLHHVAISALVEGHMRMHLVEHELSGPFEETLTTDGRRAATLKRHLNASIALQTFAYTAARSVPWMFAENAAERDHVLRYYRECCDAIKPPVCLWLAHQVSLLALHRRGYSYWLAGDRPRAYRDFYKLKRLIRQVTRSLEMNVNRPPRHREFLDGLYALAEHHTGGIYQADHAHDLALRHFNNATMRLGRLDASHHELLHNSRWRVQLLIGQGKAYYELGRVKASLLCYVEAWRALLQLIDTEAKTDSNPGVANGLIDWLRLVVDEPDVNKAQLRDRFAPLIRQFRTMAHSGHLTGLAADIMALIGHVFVVLKLPGERAHRDDGLARGALTQAAHLSFRSTMLAADLLKIEQRRLEGESPDPRGTPAAPSIRDHWPGGGGGRFEEAARVIEYLLHSWLDVDGQRDGARPPGERTAGDAERPVEEIDQTIAADLLRAYLTHTDSSNVKLAQVYRYLMQEPTPVGNRPAGPPTIDLVCARRYSSFFPFLPRPSAFHVRGGGYFARVVDDGLAERARTLELPDADAKRAFGIAIDPGPDFLDNLYRCGFGLADIDMIVVTHDHADHIASLDALLSLLGYKDSLLGDPRFRTRESEPCGVLLPIVGNPSVVERYEFFNSRRPLDDKPRKDAVLVMGFDDLGRWIDSGGEWPAGWQPSAEPDPSSRILLPPSLRVEAVESFRHYDGHGHLAVGFALSLEQDGHRASVGFTSDTGWPDDESKAAWPGEADVVMAHVSGVPLPDLRGLAGLDRSPAAARAETEAFDELWQRAGVEEDGDGEGGRSRRFLLRRLQFGFRSRSEDPGDLSVSPLSPIPMIKESPRSHLYLKGLLALAHRLRAREPRRRPGLLLIGELREELGSFRTRIAAELNNELFGKFASTPGSSASALTADIGLRVQVCSTAAADEVPGDEEKIKVLCSTCDLDNDLTEGERFHSPAEIHEVCVKGENEGVFYNCRHHDPQSQREPMYVELVERYDVFGQ